MEDKEELRRQRKPRDNVERWRKGIVEGYIIAAVVDNPPTKGVKAPALLFPSLHSCRGGKSDCMAAAARTFQHVRHPELSITLTLLL